MNKTFTIRRDDLCLLCCRSRKRAVSNLEGVAGARVNLATEKLSVDFDENRISALDIIEAVKKAGFTAYRGQG